MLLIGLQQNQSREWDTIHQEGDMKKSYHPLDGGVIWDISEDDIGGDMMLVGVYSLKLLMVVRNMLIKHIFLFPALEGVSPDEEELKKLFQTKWI